MSIPRNNDSFYKEAGCSNQGYKKIPSSNSKLALWMMIHQSKVIIREE
ncbi:hypothetical protein M089_3032 [Bacteroides ovatus str. 3725 D9 iii]|uniref:Uncharacterized protein n=1 Tax=Bacteroides ovatus (strain ATCC 8483 / DSM 1896 / JCM 5824 / BCRC 10623 / CCUG 4943 / NCTC 11153) TaxID=411476 RepID=A0AAN3D7V5_BACO1|nr:hypothetical protein BACOVA_04375 [Bacteroides ovatus ATCC 8483]EEO53550.1 hypothetical protein BSCG_00475 [Bacteroides sp. 2_2_4]KDS20745.1 hypothetical protein M082_1388 [Bacteroides fragilis str. 3725 D9 ii]KDS24558.1 hypothetical protein M088_4898 [Bacteroides ovatus str. 3725 D1 iv]KDS39386.1 hypothetical protein M089_3032 [Bacteroides ovatus str. 3725 D9 iii]CAG9869355.1 hypothetical protein BOVAC1_3710 [Bacteroides ovatus]